MVQKFEPAMKCSIVNNVMSGNGTLLSLGALVVQYDWFFKTCRSFFWKADEQHCHTYSIHCSNDKGLDQIGKLNTAFTFTSRPRSTKS